jgi:hypothetical protein
MIAILKEANHMKVRTQVRGEGKSYGEATSHVQQAAYYVAQGGYSVVVRNNYKEGSTYIELWTIEYESR